VTRGLAKSLSRFQQGGIVIKAEFREGKLNSMVGDVLLHCRKLGEERSKD
jgi:hypothetical protein